MVNLQFSWVTTFSLIYFSYLSINENKVCKILILTNFKNNILIETPFFFFFFLINTLEFVLLGSTSAVRAVILYP